MQNNLYSAGFFLRKYKYLGAGFYFFAGPELEWTYSDQTQDQTVDYRQDERVSNFDLGIETGVAYALSRHWQLEVEFPNVLEASYQHQNYTYNIPTQAGVTPYETHQVYNSYNFATSLSTDFQLVVGLRYLIGS
ncbi:MAG TPA: hypothetical protein VG101_20360 [Puia sp.]|nr:hypothetical protein [Puia sp.]